jgi:fermentation-respiration switch protein FrsA (DUF1100 family)
MNVEPQLVDRQDARRRNRGRVLLRVCAYPVVIYLGIVAYLWANETRLVYPGQDASVGNWEPDAFEREVVKIKSNDGTLIDAWYLPNENAQRDIVVFHGNAENVATTSSGYAVRLGRELRANVLVFDYRGFGRTPGKPAESNLLDDGTAAVRWLMDRRKLKPEEIIYYGSSIGGGVAVGVAERLPPQMLLLDRTFSSLVYPAQSRYPWIPVGLIMSNRYDSAIKIKKYLGPVLLSHFEDDELIPMASAETLFDAIPGPPKTFLRMPGGDHLAPLPESYWESLRRFVDEHASVD